MVPEPSPGLPYSPAVRRVIDPLHRAFVPINRVMAPILDAGLGPWLSNPITGYLMVLRTRGRRSGLVRAAPLGYVILDGSIYCCAGFGARTTWYLNLVAEPSVEVVLPGRTLTALAEPVTDPGEWVRAYRALMRSLGLISRLALGNLDRTDDATLLRTHAGLPLVRITPTGQVAGTLVAGELDPGGRFWLVSFGMWLVALAGGARWLGRRRSGEKRNHRRR